MRKTRVYHYESFQRMGPLSRREENMLFNYKHSHNNTSTLALSRFIANRWKALFFLYFSAIFTLYLHLKDLNFLVAALSCFFSGVLLANNILLTMEVHRDKLTGLGNKIALQIRLQREISRIDRNGGYLTFLFFDIDNFKEINDTCGHKVGDNVLIEVAHRLMAEMRNYDSLIRYGGDEFCVICPQVRNVEDSIKIRNKLEDTLNFLYRCENHNLHIQTSLGMSTYPLDTNDMQELIQIADHRMYEQKQKRKLARIAHTVINE